MVLKGYYIPCGYMGWVGGRITGAYMLFASESDYLEFVME